MMMLVCMYVWVMADVQETQTGVWTLLPKLLLQVEMVVVH
jgi:hypothetical protein